MLTEVYGADTGDLGALTRLGNCTLAQGLLPESVALLERAVVLHPGEAVLTEQLVLARIALALSEGAERTEARQVAAPQPRPQSLPTRPGIVHVVAEEPELPGIQAFGRVSLQKVYSSNVNGGTYNADFIGFGLPLVVAPESREQAGFATRLTADGSVILPLDWENAAMFSAGLSGTLQDVHSAHSRLDLLLSGAWITGTNVTGGQIRSHLDLNWVGGLYEGLSVGAEGSAHHMIREGTTLTGLIDVTHRFQTAVVDAGWDISGRVGVRQVIGPDLQAGASVIAQRVAVGSAARSYWLVGAEALVSGALTQELGFTLNAGVDLVGFDGSIAMFPGTRADTRWRMGAGLDWSLAHIAEGLSMQANYSFSHQQSNQDLFDTNRHLAAVSLSYSF